MSEKTKGKFKYEIIIALLIVALIFTLTYPPKVWKQEKEQEAMCQARMDAIQKLELQYNSLFFTYSDSIDEVIDTVMINPALTTALDSTINWDGLISNNELKKIVREADFPEIMRIHILEKLSANQPLANLGRWDSLNYRLIDKLEIVMNDSMNPSASIDTSIDWTQMIGGRLKLRSVMAQAEMPRNALTRSNRDIREDIPIQETAAWRYVKPMLYDSLKKLIENAERADTWAKNENDKWKEMRREQWEAEMDTLSQVYRDSLWLTNQGKFWNKEKELIWKKDRNKLRKNEIKAWREENISTWQRIALQQWKQARRKKWIQEMPKNNRGLFDLIIVQPEVVEMDSAVGDLSPVEPDTVEPEPVIAYEDLSKDSLASLHEYLQDVFEIKKDSLWRTVTNDLQKQEFEGWIKDNEKDVNEVVINLWERERRVTWEEARFQEWLSQKEEDREALWTEIKEELWKVGVDILWKIEEDKLASKSNAQRRLDQAVKWYNILNEEQINMMVDDLDLPNSKTVWQAIEKTEAKGSVLHALGVAGIFNDVLVQKVKLCPVANVPYMINVIDTTALKYFEIHCPIVDTSKTLHALKIDPAIKDTSEVKLGVGFLKKVLSNASIKNHGNIDKQGRKSWDRRTR